MTLLRIYTVLFFLMIMVSCGQSEQPDGARIIWDKHANGNHKTVHQFLTDPGDFSADYYYREYFENGNIKINGLENRRVRKGEWKIYFETGELRSVVTFNNGTLHGPMTVYDKNGTIIATDTAESGFLKNQNTKIINLITNNIDLSDNRTNWDDSLSQTIDSLKKIIEN